VDLTGCPKVKNFLRRPMKLAGAQKIVRRNLIGQRPNLLGTRRSCQNHAHNNAIVLVVATRMNWLRSVSVTCGKQVRIETEVGRRA
jgi:hypothetical protein